jgi:ribonucleoside-diphosphate reductase alpha chain
MAMALAEDEPKDARLRHAVNWYNHFSFNRINAPTPNYVNLGTTHNGYASCCLYAVDDNAQSLAIGDHIAYTMTYMSAGIGGIINTRSLGDSVRNGTITHMGKLPYYRSLAGAVKANLQGGRGGACTTYFSCFDPEVLTIINLQNPRSTRDKQNRDIHFAIMFNRFFAVKVMKNEDIFTFNIKTAPDLMDAFFDGDNQKFETIYNAYENNPEFKKNYISARKILLAAGQQSFDVGTLYYFIIDEANRHTPFKDAIHSSNLCVAPETKILTDKGYLRISDLKDEEVNVWNGQKFSKTVVRQTSEISKLIKVITDSGYWLYCTPYHKFYIQKDYQSTQPIEIQASELQPGMKLIKFDLPIIEGDLTMVDPYINGFYTGDGCKTHHGQRIYLYGEKRKLVDKFPGGSDWTTHEDQDRMIKHYKHLHPKFFVPGSEFTIQSRLKWLAGFADADGSIYRNGENQQLVLSSANRIFLERISLMLQTIGIMSKTRFSVGEGMRMLPANDGSGQHQRNTF